VAIFKLIQAVDVHAQWDISRGVLQARVVREERVVKGASPEAMEFLTFSPAASLPVVEPFLIHVVNVIVERYWSSDWSLRFVRGTYRVLMIRCRCCVVSR